MVAGLPCCVLLSWSHNHDIATAEALSYRSAGSELRSTFMEYFSEGMTPSAAMKYHKDSIEMAVDFMEQHLADGSKNPLPRCVYLWHNQWRRDNLGMLLISDISLSVITTTEIETELFSKYFANIMTKVLGAIFTVRSIIYT